MRSTPSSEKHFVTPDVFSVSPTRLSHASPIVVAHGRLFESPYTGPSGAAAKHDLSFNHATDRSETGSSVHEVEISKTIVKSAATLIFSLEMDEAIQALADMREQLDNIELDPVFVSAMHNIDRRDWHSPQRPHQMTWDERLADTDFIMDAMAIMMDSIAKSIMLGELKEKYDVRSLLEGSIPVEVIDEVWETLNIEGRSSSFGRRLFDELIEDIKMGWVIDCTDKIMIGAYLNSKPCGLLIMSDGYPPCIDNIVTLPTKKSDNKGTGSALIEYAVHRSESWEKEGKLILSPNNSASRKVYDALGFISLPNDYMSLEPAVSEKWRRVQGDGWRLGKYVKDKEIER